MPDGPVVVNNTPLAALWALGRLDLLEGLFQEILIPEAVRDEFLAVEVGPRRAQLESSPWIRVGSVIDRRRVQSFSDLDLGEAEVLALASERDARLIIMDERKGRRYAQRLDIPLTGTLGVLVLAKEKSLIGSVKNLITELIESGMYLSPKLVAEVLTLSNEQG